MSDLPRRKRSLITTFVAILVVSATLIGLLVVRVNTFLFRRNVVPLESLKFPVLIIQPNELSPFAEWEAVQLEKFPPKSPRTPVDGTVVIDSDFNLFTQENVQRKQEGDLKWMARILLPDLRVKYTFDLRRTKTAGRDAAIARLLQCPPFSDNPPEDASIRKAINTQTTLAGVLDALKLYKPIEPAPTTMPEHESSESPPATQGAESDEPLP